MTFEAKNFYKRVSNVKEKTLITYLLTSNEPMIYRQRGRVVKAGS